ncbi:hypothetical protein [Campylobacter troglodytis]|uniref:hypothetical protein n=1 Tax=Campylobacter troglodytis TaxID=654363 RepID=UPI0011579386|nr:hypothetical protein [Campylobacter troglodytis]TQR60458.1 hypothetical protein DMC01_05630 [Campylobacter troglodytis]
MKKFFILASFLLASQLAFAKVVKLSVEADLNKVVDSISFDISQGKDALADKLYAYCLKPPQKVQNAFKKAAAFNGRIRIGFYNPRALVNAHGGKFLSHIMSCEYDKAKGYSLSKMNELNVVRPDLAKELIIQGISESMEYPGDGNWYELVRLMEE